jgi:predicted nucleic acid-binding protein
MLKVILDGNVFARALINPHGKLSEILDDVFENRVRLFASLSIIEKLEQVLSYPKLIDRHGLEKKENWLGYSLSAPNGNTQGAVVKVATTVDSFASCRSLLIDCDELPGCLPNSIEGENRPCSRRFSLPTEAK